MYNFVLIVSFFLPTMMSSYWCVHPLRPSAGTGHCHKCEASIEKDTLCHKAYGKGMRYPCKLCEGCCQGPTTGYTAAEMKIIKRAIDEYKKELYKKYGVTKLAVDAAAVAASTEHGANHAYGFYGKTSSDGHQFKQRHPFSNYFRGEIIIPGVGVFDCTEAIVMFVKALVMGDGTTAYALVTRGPLSGSACKGFGKMVHGFVKAKWNATIPKLALLVALTKWDQCPMFQDEMRRIHAKRFTTVHECSKSDRMWGTGSALGQPLGPGLNYLGKGLTYVLGSL